MLVQVNFSALLSEHLPKGLILDHVNVDGVRRVLVQLHERIVVRNCSLTNINIKKNISDLVDFVPHVQKVLAEISSRPYGRSLLLQWQDKVPINAFQLVNELVNSFVNSLAAFPALRVRFFRL